MDTRLERISNECSKIIKEKADLFSKTTLEVPEEEQINLLDPED